MIWLLTLVLLQYVEYAAGEALIARGIEFSAFSALGPVSFLACKPDIRVDVLPDSLIYARWRKHGSERCLSLDSVRVAEAGTTTGSVGWTPHPPRG